MAKNIKDTAEYAHLLAVRAVIQDNKKHFVPGASIGANIILGTLGIKIPSFKGLNKDETLAKAVAFGRVRSTWQTRFNRILAQRGLYMSQSNGNFYIKSRKQTVAKVASFHKAAASRTARAEELSEGINSYNYKYSKVKLPVIAKIASGIIAR